MKSSRVVKSRKVPTLVLTLVLGSMFILAPITAGAVVIDVDLVLKPDGKGADGKGVGKLDLDAKTLVLEKFAFKGTSTDPDNLTQIFDLKATKAFTLNWSKQALAVVFSIDSIKQGVGIGGTYDTDNPKFPGLIGSWKLSQRTIPEPGSLALLGMALIGFGLAWRRRKTV